MKRLAMLFLVLGVGACQTTGGDEPFASPDRSGTITLFVESRTQADVEVTLLGTGVEIDLGVVRGLRSQGFTLNWPRSGDLHARLQIPGGLRYDTVPVLAHSGDRLELLILETLRQSELRNRR